MRKLITGFALLFAATMAQAEMRFDQQVAAFTWTNVGGNSASLLTKTWANMKGTLEEMQIDFPSEAGVTGKVSIYVTQANGTTYNIFTNDVLTADVTCLPTRWLHIGAVGSIAPTNYPPVKIALANDTITCTVTNVGARQTNISYTFNLKYSN